jgi:hypothetical protein
MRAGADGGLAVAETRRRAAPAVRIPKERANFKSLLLKNPNYFGNLAKAANKAVSKISSDTAYEELTCVGFNPQTNFLEATVAIKRPSGYMGGLCFFGSTEYVRFFLDYGGGWEDAGLAAIRVHDIPTERDCARELEKPLTYVATLRLESKQQECCYKPVLPKVHAILSWEWVPPPGPANVGWTPVWGNTLDCEIQIKPRPWSIACLIELLGDELHQKLKIPDVLQTVQYQPIPLPDPPPLDLSQVAALYAARPKATSASRARAKATFSVEPHRFGTSSLHPLIAEGGFNAQIAQSASAQWSALQVDLAAIVAALENTTANVTYEELECVGLDETAPERLVATFRIKRPFGYSGSLCQHGSVEYVAFWADWDDECAWTYLGTAQVNVHDIAQIPSAGLSYSAILPVDLTHHRRGCKQPKIARVRAVLSWAVPPSTTDPDNLRYWGNRLDSHVQIPPGDEIPPGEVSAKIRNIGGIAVEDIDWLTTGMTRLGGSPVIFAHHPWATADAWGLGRACPFGGMVEIEGEFFKGFYYRVKVRKSTDPPGVFTTLADSFWLERWDWGFDLQATVANGFFAYKDPSFYADIHLAYWQSAGHDELWQVQLDIATAPIETSIIASSPWYGIQLDNTAPVPPPALNPTIDIHIAAGGDCKDFDQGGVLSGTFIADDLHFGAWGLSTEPNSLTTPSNQPRPDPFLAPTSPAPGPSGHGWKLDTSSPVMMKPCGYVIRLDVSDRSIVNSGPYAHNWNHIEVGFCVREA